MKSISVELCEEYYNPEWFYSIDYDYYNDFVKEHISELVEIIENKDYTAFVDFCKYHDIILPNNDHTSIYYEYEITFDNNPASVHIYVYSDDEDNPGGGSLDLYVTEI